MFETLFLKLSEADDYLDIGALSFLFALTSILLVQHFLHFQVEGDNLAGLIAVLVTSLAVAYPFVRYIDREEEAELQARWSESRLLRRHLNEIALYSWFFWGVTLAFAASTYLVPDAFYTVQSGVLQGMIGPTANISGGLSLGTIISNNLWVFGLTFLLSFVFSAGVLFILAWNASVLGVLIGQLSQSVLHLPGTTLPFLPHGIPEIGGYVIAGIAGSLLSHQVEHVLFTDNRLNATVLRDVTVLTLLGLAVIVIAGIIEVML